MKIEVKAKIVEKLTGKKTVNKGDIQCLRDLGLTVEVAELSL